MESGIQQFRRYESINDNINEIINDLRPKINRIKDQILQFDFVTNEERIHYGDHEYLHYSLSSPLYAFNSLEYVSMIVSNDLLCLLL